MLPFDAAAASELCLELDGWRDRLDTQLTLRREWEGRLRRELEAGAVAASTSMEGVPVTVDEVRRILAGDVVPDVGEGDRRLVEGYRDAMSFVLRRADDGRLQWHRELLVGLQDHVLARNYAAGAGRLRTADPRVVNNKTGRVVFEPPPHEQVPELVDQVCDYLDESELHPALAAAWGHVAIAAVHPFQDGNGRTARVAASLAMYRGGFRRPEFTSLEEWWGHHLDDYYGAFECLGTRFDPRADVTPFVVAHLQAQVRQVRALDLQHRTQERIWAAIARLLQNEDLPGRLAEGLWDAFMQRPLTSHYYRSVADVSVATANNDLLAAVGHRLLESHGRTRGRTYRPGERLYAELGRLLDVDVASIAQHGRTAIVHELAARLAFENLPAEAARSVERLLGELALLASDAEIRELDDAWMCADGRAMLARVRARQKALQALGLRPRRAEGWRSASDELFELVYPPLAPGRGWPQNVYEAASRALLGLVTRDLVDERTYSALVAPLALRFRWLTEPSLDVRT